MHRINNLPFPEPPLRTAVSQDGETCLSTGVCLYICSKDQGPEPVKEFSRTSRFPTYFSLFAMGGAKNHTRFIRNLAGLLEKQQPGTHKAALSFPVDTSAASIASPVL